MNSVFRSSHFLRNHCLMYRGWSRELHNRTWHFNRQSIPLIVVLSISVPFFIGFIWKGRNAAHLLESKPSLILKDPEFSGFRLVRCRQPYTTSDEVSADTWLPEDMDKCAKEARQILTGRLNPSDVLVASFPKSGTTWLSEVVYLLVTGLDWKLAASANLEERVPYLEYIWPGPKAIADCPSPRILKTHLPFFHLPEDIQTGDACRVIYIVRDPRDVVLSYYHFARCFVPAGYRNREGLDGFVNRFLNDRLPYSPWVYHVKSYLQAAAVYNGLRSKSTGSTTLVSPKVLFISYEQMKNNSKATIRAIETFIRETWTTKYESPCPEPLTDLELEQLSQHCSFNSMSKNPSTNFSWLREFGLWSCKSETTNFMRRGVIGDHETCLTDIQLNEIYNKASTGGLEWILHHSQRV